MNCLEIVESLQTLKDFQVTSQKRGKLKTSVKKKQNLMDKGGQQNSYEVFLPKRFTKREYIK